MSQYISPMLLSTYLPILGKLVWYFSYASEYTYLSILCKLVWYCGNHTICSLAINKNVSTYFHISQKNSETVTLWDYGTVFFLSHFIFDPILIKKILWMLTLRRLIKWSMTSKVIEGHKRLFLCLKIHFLSHIFFV